MFRQAKCSKILLRRILRVAQDYCTAAAYGEEEGAKSEARSIQYVAFVVSEQDIIRASGMRSPRVENNYGPGPYAGLQDFDCSTVH